MSAEKATALVLKVVEFSETSSIVTLFTREFGKTHGLAKGGRRPKGPFESALDLLALVRVVFLRKSSGTLDLLTEAKLERRFRPAPRDLTGLYAGYYLAELLGTMTDDDDPHPNLFDAAASALQAVQTPEQVLGAVVWFELRALDELGHLPSLIVCAECGVPLSASGRVPFALLDGGALCASCRVGKKQVVSVSAAAIQTLAQIAQADHTTCPTLTLDPRLLGELRGVLNRYLSHLVGHPLKMHRYLTGLRHA